MDQLAIVTPVHNDWPSFKRLLSDINACLSEICSEVTIVVVDDGSVEPPPDQLLPMGSSILKIHLVELAVNLGHQRAIAVGLSVAAKFRVDAVVVMDADGEDRPSDIPRMIELSESEPTKIIVAHRAKRSESISFRLFYFLYKITFRLCTGGQITHGNFCLIPKPRVNALLHISYTWNNLAASISRSRLPYRGLPTARGSRYEGSSKMNFISLLLHGLSAVSVYLDVFTARLLTACFAGLGLVAMLAISILSIRLFTDYAIPGWTTIILGLVAVVTLQILILSASTLFSHLNSRGQVSAIPASVAPHYIHNVTLIEQKPND